MDEKPQLPPGLTKDKLLHQYVLECRSLTSLAREYHTNYQQIRRLLTSLGIPIRGRGCSAYRGSAHPSSKLSVDSRNDLETALLAGQPHGELAREYGLSRERIRQIAETIGAPTGRQLQDRRRYERQRRKLERQQELQELRKREKHLKYRPWREMWAEGVPIKEMARRLGQKPGTVGVRIVNLRKEHPDWFPLRRPQLRQRNNPVINKEL